MELSYSQNLEDYHLSIAFAGQASGTYIDIGAGHPIADNVSFWFYERGWRGVVVEPQVKLVALYARLRPRDVAVAGLIGRECGEMDFHIVDRLHGLSTAKEEVAQVAQAFGVDYQTVRMPTTTLAELCETHDLGTIDFLKIDVEGAEGDVLFGGDWERFRPKVVVAEAIAPMTSEPSWQQWEPFLVAQRYRFVLFDTLNRFYVAEEHPEIMDRFPTERAPWHAVRHMYEIGRAPENEQHPDHALARDLARGFWACLPYLDSELIASILRRGRQIEERDDLKMLSSMVEAKNSGWRWDASPAAMTADRSSRNEARVRGEMFAASRNLPSEPPYIANIRPTGAYSTMGKASQADRLSDQIKVMRGKARHLSPGPERDELLRRIEQDEAALRVIEWVTSSAHLPPPSGLIPVKRHRLRRK